MNGAVFAIDTTVPSAVNSEVVWTIVVSGSTSIISTLFVAPWWAWLGCVTSKTLPVNKSPVTIESPSTPTDVRVLVTLSTPYLTILWPLVNFSPWTSVKNKVSRVALIAIISTLNPPPLVTLTLSLSTVKTSPNWYPEPTLVILTPVITSSVTVIVASAPIPVPVSDFKGTAVVLLNE